MGIGMAIPLFSVAVFAVVVMVCATMTKRDTKKMVLCFCVSEFCIVATTIVTAIVLFGSRQNYVVGWAILILFFSVNGFRNLMRYRKYNIPSQHNQIPTVS